MHNNRNGIKRNQKFRFLAVISKLLTTGRPNIPAGSPRWWQFTGLASSECNPFGTHPEAGRRAPHYHLAAILITPIVPDESSPSYQALWKSLGYGTTCGVFSRAGARKKHYIFPPTPGFSKERPWGKGHGAIMGIVHPQYENFPDFQDS
jgi:hypothetical protein